jgi:hypothetical protein
MAYQPEHGDIYVLADRKQLGFCVGDGVLSWPLSLVPNQWYIAGQAISKGQAVSIGTAAYASSIGTGSAGNIYISSEGSIDKTVGVALNSAILGGRVEVQSFGLYQWASAIFSAGDIGSTVYIAPGVFTSVTPLANQYTTDRSLALSSGNPLIELGIIQSTSSLFIDFEGDARNSIQTTQLIASTGEIIATNNIPTVVSMAADGKLYRSDRQKSQGLTNNRNNPLGLLISASSGFATSVPNNTVCIVQRLGLVSYSGWSLTIGKPVYLDVTGSITQTTTGLSNSTDIITPIGIAITATSIYVQVGFNTQLSDSNPIGSIVACSATAAADVSYLLCVGSAMNIVTPTVNPSGQVAGTYDGTAIFNRIGSNYGGTIQWTITGTCASSAPFTINGVAYTTTGTTAAAVATQIGGITQANYTFSNPSGGVFQIVNATGFSTPVFVPPAGMTFTITGGTFNLPSLNSGTTKFEIKYQNWYLANPINNSPYRVDTGWTTYPQIPVGSTGTIGSYFEIPVSSLGTDPLLNDLVVEIYATKAGVYKKIDSAAYIYTSGGGSPVYSKYGVSISKDIGNNVRIDIATNGMAYYDYTTQLYVALDATWQYKILIYKTERYNRYFDFSADQRALQLWSLGLVDYIQSTSIQGAGYFDRSVTMPQHTVRLNYDGYLYATNFITPNGPISSQKLTKAYQKVQNKYMVKTAVPTSFVQNTFSNSQSCIAYSPSLGKFIALANAGIPVLSSTDGTNWNSVQSNLLQKNWVSVAWSPSLSIFAAVTFGGSDIEIATSPDGITWTSYYDNLSVNSAGWLANPVNWIQIIWNPDLVQFCVIASGGSGIGTTPVMTSTNGTTWTRRTAPVTSLYWCSIAWSQALTKYVAVSNTGSNPIMTSPDGSTWNQQTSATKSWFSICWSPLNGGQFCAISLDGTASASTSPDGINWTLQSGVPTTSCGNIYWSTYLSKFITQGNSTVSTSSDGITWATNFTYATSANPGIIIAESVSLSKLVMLTNQPGSGVIFSSDGLTWATTGFLGNDNSIQWTSVCWSPELKIFCAIGTYGAISPGVSSTSSDGIYWFRHSVPTGHWNAVCWSPELGLFCAVGESPIAHKSAMISSDGINWITYDTAGIYEWGHICWSPELGLFCAIGSSVSPTTTVIATSPNGITWTSYSIPNQGWSGVIWSPELGMFCAAGIQGGANLYVITSTNGSTWVTRTLPSTFGSQWQSIAWSGELGLFCVTPGSGSYSTMTSPDGINWTQRSTGNYTGLSGTQINKIIWIAELGIFYAIGSKIFTSSDGINWIRRPDPNYAGSFPPSLNSVCWSPELGQICSILNIHYSYINLTRKVSVTPVTDVVTNTRLTAPSTKAVTNYGFNIMQNLIPANITGTIMPSFSGSYGTTIVGYSSQLKRIVLASYGASISYYWTLGDTSWSTGTLPATATSWNCMCWSSELNLFCILSSGPSNVAATSPDGITWTSRTLSSSSSWNSVCWSPELGLFCAVSGTSGTIACTSPDGINWTTRTLPSSSNWNSICWSPELSLFCTVSSTSGTLAATSPDGIYWTARTLPSSSNWSSVCWSPELGLFCAVSQSLPVIALSSDGISWKQVRLPISNTSVVSSIAWSNTARMFIVKSTNGIILTSIDGYNWISRSMGLSSAYYSYSTIWAPEFNSFFVTPSSVASGVIEQYKVIPVTKL